MRCFTRATRNLVLHLFETLSLMHPSTPTTSSNLTEYTAGVTFPCNLIIHTLLSHINNANHKLWTAIVPIATHDIRRRCRQGDRRSTLSDLLRRCSIHSHSCAAKDMRRGTSTPAIAIDRRGSNNLIFQVSCAGRRIRRLWLRHSSSLSSTTKAASVLVASATTSSTRTLCANQRYCGVL